MIDEQNKEGVEEEFEIVETPEAAEKAAPPEEDERLRNSDDEDEDEDNSGGEQETPEQRAERRREERRKRKERQRRAEAESKAEIQRLREQNEFLAAKMQQVEAVTLRNEARVVDQRLFDAKARYDYAERKHEEAIARGDGIGATKALRERDAAAMDYREAEGLRTRMMAETPERRQPERQQPKGPDPRLVTKAKSFIEKHSWIDPTGMKDEDSAVARALDMKLQADGYDPTTDEYWERLEQRLKERLPHRFKQSGGRSAPPVAGGSDRAGSGKKPFYLSPERKKALIDSGDWDDIARRNKMIKSYAAYDAQQKSTATR